VSGEVIENGHETDASLTIEGESGGGGGARDRHAACAVTQLDTTREPALLGRKQVPVSKTLAQRVQRISTAPTRVPAAQADARFGKRAVRSDAWRPGTISFLSGERFDVVVRSISETGARIEFVRNAYLPDRVKLTAQGMTRWAYVSWQTWGVAGLQFVGESKSQGRGA